MNNDKKKDLKKGFPGGFFWFLLAAFFLAMMVQSFMETKFATVSFNYQLEHLVNLDLIQPEESIKTAINDKLVTFSGRFRDQITDDGKKRSKYLGLLNENHNLKTEKEKINTDLASLKDKITDSADLFLHISGIPIPSNGYVIVDELQGGIDFKDLSIVIYNLSPRSIVSLPEIKSEFANLSDNPNDKKVTQFGDLLGMLIHQFKSPELGIGNEEIKQTLRNISKDISNVNTSNTSMALKLAIFEKVLDQLKDIVDQLDLSEDRVRLGELRSVRNYRDSASEYNKVSTKLEENIAQLDNAKQKVSDVIWYFDNKEVSTNGLEREDPEKFNRWHINSKKEWEAFNDNRGGFFKAPDQPLNTVLEKTFKSEEPTPNYFSYLITFLPILLVILVLYFIFSRQMKGMGSGAMNFGKSPAKLMTSDNNKITFKDVAGIDEALEELEEIVEFLKNPKKFTALGGHIPKGVLCIGPPGTGKTLIAKAVAGEADRPFFSISGSDFVEMFVGVGASRIRDMFGQAKKQSPCIVFIDEIDAVGRHRGAGIGGGHDEREQTLNQLLVEMDGFATNEGVIIIAATNRPDVLDKALLRPGRFDRQVIINLPDIKGRFEILKVHAKKIKMDESCDLMSIARGSPGSSGADLENILNESALIAAKKERNAVTSEDLNEAKDKVIYGKERRSLEMDENEKQTTAYHESGHTIVGLSVEHSDPIDKVTIIPRGMSLGGTQFLPEKNKHSYWKKELLDQIAMLMGGRCAEEIFVNDISSGARQDIKQATHIARSMVCELGMSEKLGVVSYEEPQDSGGYIGMLSQHDKKYSEETAKSIDEEVRKILDTANRYAKKIIETNKKKVQLMADMLMEFETLDNEDIKKIYNDEWNIEEKQAKLKKIKNHRKKKQTTPPPLPVKDRKKKETKGHPSSPGLTNDLKA